MSDLRLVQVIIVGAFLRDEDVRDESFLVWQGRFCDMPLSERGNMTRDIAASTGSSSGNYKWITISSNPTLLTKCTTRCFPTDPTEHPGIPTDHKLFNTTVLTLVLLSCLSTSIKRLICDDSEIFWNDALLCGTGGSSIHLKVDRLKTCLSRTFVCVFSRRYRLSSVANNGWWGNSARRAGLQWYPLQRVSIRT